MENAMLFEHRTIPKRIAITSNQFSIGRSLDNSYVVEDISVSRRHSVLEYSNNDWYIHDKSSNGTWLNERLMDKHRPAKLTDGDIIKLSDSCQYTFKIMPPNPVAPRHLSEDEIVRAAEEVIAIADAFNCEFSVEDLSCNNENSSLPASNIKQIEHIIGTQPNTTKDQNVPACNAETTEGPSCSTKPSKCMLGFLEEELQCSICTEMFIKAVTLGCSHTFCCYCISEWQKNKPDCPICRTKITVKCPTIILDNYIDKILETTDDEYKKYRQEITAQREAAIVAAAQNGAAAQNTSRPTLVNRPPPIEISSDEGGYDDDDDDEDITEYSGSEWDEDYNSDSGGTPSAYYGGYGRCYSCGRRGHWSNGCPNRRAF